MKQLKVDAASARKAYHDGSADTKKTLRCLLGDNLFNQDVQDRIKTFDDVLAELGEQDEEVEDLLDYEGSNPDMLGAKAMLKLTMIAKVLNEGWTPDWSNSSEYKYYPWMKYKAGSGFSYSGYDCAYAFTGVGSRLCFKTRELALYAGKQFEDLYKEYFLMLK